jgi:hypothetical protein
MSSRVSPMLEAQKTIPALAMSSYTTWREIM